MKKPNIILVDTATSTVDFYSSREEVRTQLWQENDYEVKDRYLLLELDEFLGTYTSYTPVMTMKFELL